MKPTSGLGAEQVINLPQGPIRVYQRGQGTPIVFVHGLFANAAAWRKVVPLLADRHRCISADWPFGSHHLAMAPDADLTPPGIAGIIADVIAALELEDVTLVGNDGGGMLAQLVVTQRPEHLGRLVLTPCDAYDNFPPPMFRYLCWLARIPGAITLLAHALRIRRLRRLPNAYGWLSHQPVEHDVLDHYLAPLRHRQIRRDATKILRRVSARHTLAAARQFHTFTKPVLVAWASDDRFFPLTHGRQLAADFPDARLVIVAGSRTYIPEDQPERLAALIADTAAGTGDPAPTTGSSQTTSAATSQSQPEGR